MNKKIKGMILGVCMGICFTCTATAATINISGQLYTKNPFYSAPKGYAQTYGHKYIYAKCSVSKRGYKTKSTSNSKYCSEGVVETDWVYGPTWKSSGTTFFSNHRGYDYYGNFQTITKSKQM